MEAIVTRELTKRYRSNWGRLRAPSLDRLELRIGENEVFGFLGRNGAGKTTAIKILCSLLRPTQGDAFVFGANVRTRKARERIGYLPESPYFYEYLTPRETIDFYGQLHGLDAVSRAREWKKLAELLDLGGIGNQRIREFSKGMRQRLGFAVALVGNPEVLILDEPMSGLDPLGRRAFRELILRLRDEKKTLFFGSHVLADVEQICSRVGILVRGKLTSQGRLDELLTRQIRLVEVIVNRLDSSARAALATKASSARESEAGQHFYFDDLAAANDAVRIVHTNGAELVEFTPVRESLEDYFLRQQEGPP
ncbi:MAG: ABC transporter ATP-binding protein [Candidatus Hydrogenedentes bacterium]|nr:ABC transporter ATP-binding protein [Candidatus Hydrogenedentota bacterium]